MKGIEKVKLVRHILRWRLTWGRRDLDFLPKIDRGDKFISARQAAALVPDGSCLFSSGIAGNARCSIFFYAIRDRFERTGHPNRLTWVNSAAQGSRGRVPGTIEELGLPGIMESYLAGHLETAKAQLRLGEDSKLALYTLPQGIIARLLEAQAQGETALRSSVGVGTFLDPRVGKGSKVNAAATKQFIAEDGDQLIYSMPQPDLALFSAPYADRKGNIYFRDASTITENMPSLQSVKRHGGRVMVAVSKIVEEDPEAIDVPASLVDHIVVNPYNEQVASVLQRRYWPCFTPGGSGDIRAYAERLRFINTFLKITPVRKGVSQFIAREAAGIFKKITPGGGIVNIGVGLPEEVVRVLVDDGLVDNYIFTTEAGSYGGLPAPGIFFGAAIFPEHLESSAEMFRRYQHSLETAILGFLQVDSKGNVNVSNRGDKVTDYVGPGGFPDIVHGARNIIFIGSWMHQAKIVYSNGHVRILKPGIPKFVDSVREITFSGKEALKMGKQVYYVTEVGVFQLTDEGLTLVRSFPGIDVERDILGLSQARLFVPEAVEHDTNQLR